jgi:hypothetical protein
MPPCSINFNKLRFSINQYPPKFNLILENIRIIFVSQIFQGVLSRNAQHPLEKKTEVQVQGRRPQ